MFGLLTVLDEDTFRNFVIDLVDESMSKPKAYKAAINKTKRQSCPICKGNHWKRDCPKQEFKNKGQKVGYVTTNEKIESESDLHEDHFANLCINEGESNDGPKCLLATYLSKDKSTKNEEDIWYIDSGATDHMISDLDSFVDISHERGPNVKGIGGMIPIEGKGTVEKYGYTITDASYAPKMPCNLLSVFRMVTNSGYSLIFTEDEVFAVELKKEMLKGAYKVGTKHKGLYKLLPRVRTSALCGWKINLVFDKNLNIVQDERHMRIMLGNYKAIING